MLNATSAITLRGSLRSLVWIVLLVTSETAVLAATQPVVGIHLPRPGCSTIPAELWKPDDPVRFLKEALRSDGTPFRELTATQLIQPGALVIGDSPNFPIVFSIGTECVSDDELKALRGFVNVGGTVFFGGPSWLRDQNGNARSRFGLPPGEFDMNLGLAPTSGNISEYWAYTAQVLTSQNLASSIDHLAANTTYVWQLPIARDAIAYEPSHLAVAAKTTNGSNAQVDLWMSLARGFAGAYIVPPIEDLSRQLVVTDPNALDGPQFADVDRDGRSDVIFRKGTTLYLRRSTGHSFKEPEDWGYSAPGYLWRIADMNGVAETNGKKCPELIQWHPSSADRLVYVTNGHCTPFATFAETVTWGTWPANSSFDLIDMDKDGKSDLVSRTPDFHVLIGLSNGTGFMPPYDAMPGNTWPAPYDLTFANVDNQASFDAIGRSPTDPNGLIYVSRSYIDESTPTAPVKFALAEVWAAIGKVPTSANVSSGHLYRVGDVDGDGRADLVVWASEELGPGVYQRSAVMIGRSAESTATKPYPHFSFTSPDDPPQFWGRFDPAITAGLSDSDALGLQRAFQLADVNGDGPMDLVGCRCTSSTSTDRYPTGSLMVSLSTGSVSPAPYEFVYLARVNVGLGHYVYHAPLMPLAGYAGFSNDNSEYKIIRTSIEEAFKRAAVSLPLLTVSPWPYAYNVAMINRHDHWFASDVSLLEDTYNIVPQTLSRFGEYYLLPRPNYNGVQTNDRCPEGSRPAGYVNQLDNRDQARSHVNKLIGSHTTNHQILDYVNHTTGRNQLKSTRDLLNGELGSNPPIVSDAFVAPVGPAIRRLSMQAIADEGFVTTGEQGVGPFPHFSIDTDAPDGYIGSQSKGALLQLPTSEWPGGYGSMENMVAIGGGSGDTPIPNAAIERAAELSYRLGGLINVYDHVAADAYSVNPCGILRLSLAKRLLGRVAQLNQQDDPVTNRVWFTSSLDLRDWWLQRDRRQISTSSGTSVVRTAANTDIRVEISIASGRKGTPSSESLYGILGEVVALRLRLDPVSVSHRQQGISAIVTVGGVPLSAQFRYRDSSPDLYVLLPSGLSTGAMNVRIVLGPQ